MQRGFAPILVLVGILVILVVTGGAFYYIKSQPPASLEEAVYRQNPVIFPSMKPNPTDKPFPDVSSLNADNTTGLKTY